ncbi:nitrate- and nitrite sensing domain-containing protein [Nonomuraea gerenzanensis]|uniref:histidine kinase n=1 Tax=Nonomuraea gerenzanensis TaxID=93944 RepID=A0A1M4EIQ0_9ACTN|nr:nitrate- and nitrite sensing domain-containing protein [Nonomuraea gerenzanensis]UBU10394.1 nitrate- and nitrite sensing domain-containing protein [Nonomuraea gerenzanensis]SBO98787.1 Putative sensor-like histidine kinase [Nonomuraea gerenzanensis]
MRFRKTRLRTKITAMLLSLAALWVFAAWVTLREGVNLLWVSQLDASVSAPSDPLLFALQRERRLSMVRLSEKTVQTRKELETQRKETDRLHAAFREEADTTVVSWALDDQGEERLAGMLKRLESLKEIRKSIDAGRFDRGQTSGAYDGVIDPIYALYGSLATLDDKELAKDVRSLLALSRARELLTREDALLASALGEGRLTPATVAEFAQLVGSWRITAEQAATDLPDSDRAAYDKLVKGQASVRLQSLERQVMQYDQAALSLPFTTEEWKAATERFLADFNTMVLDAGDRVVDRTVPVAVNVIIRLVLAGGLGLLAVIASIILSITTARALLAQLQKLRDAAHELSDERLPGIVERIGHGEEVDVAKEAPALDFGDDEIGQVGQAFNTVQRTAIAVAAEQAELRRSIRDILLSLARRTQGLVHRQLTVLDVMERRETDPEELKELFRLDHLAIRMRRNAENLIVLSGSSPARTWRRSVPMVDVVRGALAEVEDYTRVSLLPMGDVVLVGRAVGDVIHLLAELIENAVSFSPPYTNVQVSGQLVANGYVIEIEDRGLGMKPEDLDAANERIADPPEFRITGTARLGLYVVSQLARRHDIQVVLKASPYGGTTVVVLLPQELVQLDPTPEPRDGGTREGLPRRQPAVATATRPATAENVRTLPSRPVPASVPEPRPARSARQEAAPRPVRPARPEPVPAPEPSAPTPAEPEQESVTEFTPGGLPLRVPQANLAPALRDDTPTQPDLEEDDDERSPEEIRAMMGSLQSGTRRGRSQAAKMLEEQQGGDA